MGDRLPPQDFAAHHWQAVLRQKRIYFSFANKASAAACDDAGF
jgi:hypothetical protein